MKKLLTALLSLSVILVPLQVAQANDQRVVAIIDTAIDSNKVTSVIHEVCFTTAPKAACPNNANFMEGKGAANSPVWPSSMLHPVYHGHHMAQVALTASPNIKIVFIRISDIFSNGSSINVGQNLSNAMDWVSKNASKYSIDAVSVSQSRVNWTTCPTDLLVSNAIKSLETQNIPTFVATGNNRLTNKVGFPACVDGAIGVGAVTSNGSMFSAVTNRGPGLDAVAVGDMNITRYNGTRASISGTSVANAAASAKYVGQTNLFSQFISGFTKFLTYPLIK